MKTIMSGQSVERKLYKGLKYVSNFLVMSFFLMHSKNACNFFPPFYIFQVSYRFQGRNWFVTAILKKISPLIMEQESILNSSPQEKERNILTCCICHYDQVFELKIIFEWLKLCNVYEMLQVFLEQDRGNNLFLTIWATIIILPDQRAVCQLCWAGWQTPAQHPWL